MLTSAMVVKSWKLCLLLVLSEIRYMTVVLKLLMLCRIVLITLRLSLKILMMSSRNRLVWIRMIVLLICSPMRRLPLIALKLRRLWQVVTVRTLSTRILLLLLVRVMNAGLKIMVSILSMRVMIVLRNVRLALNNNQGEGTTI